MIIVENIDKAGGAYPLLGDHLALNLLNTQAGMGESRVEHWHAAADVIAWCRCNGIEVAPDRSLDDADGLLDAARALRALARELIEQRKQGGLAEVGRLNPYLEANPSVAHVVVEAGAPRLLRLARADAKAQLLGAIAESVAALLVEGDFGLVKQCEHPDCVLWFYDRTKAHRRRWCSMTVCGNRFKAAQFRKNAAARS